MIGRRLAVLRAWPPRRWLVALAAGAAFVLVVAVPTDLIDTPVFGREIPPTWWAWPSLAGLVGLGGLLVATYVARTGRSPIAVDAVAAAGSAASLTYFAVGCPVCNKLVLARARQRRCRSPGSSRSSRCSRASPSLLLAWALRSRLLGELSCPTDPSGDVARA